MASATATAAPASHATTLTASSSTSTAPAIRSAGPPATAEAAPTRRSIAILTPGAWATAGTESDCGSVLTSDLVAYAAADGPVTPATGGTLAVHLHNNTTLCNAAGRTLTLAASGWDLDIVPLGTMAAVASAALPAPPATLAPGAQARLPVRVGAGLAPGWYTAPVRAPGAGAPPVASTSALQSIERFLVTAGPRAAGRATTDAYPAPTVGGLAMPLVRLTWNAQDNAAITVHAALTCGPGTDRYASFADATATAAGPGFTTDIPIIGGGQDPAIAEASWDFQFPGEAASLTLAARVQVRACGSGALLGSNGVAWKVDLG